MYVTGRLNKNNFKTIVTVTTNEIIANSPKFDLFLEFIKPLADWHLTNKRSVHDCAAHFESKIVDREIENFKSIVVQQQ